MTLAASPINVEVIDSGWDAENDDTTVSASTKPRKQVAGESVDITAYIHIQIPPPPPTRIRKSQKPLLPQIKKSGPMLFSSTISYEEFLVHLARDDALRLAARRVS